MRSASRSLNHSLRVPVFFFFFIPAAPLPDSPIVSSSFADDCMTNGFFNGQAPLPQGYGYGIVIAFGLFFSIVTSFLVWLDYRYGGTKQTSEQFNTAGRSVKTGLIANVIVSEWTWAATLLQSSNVAWQYGVSGPFWYAAGATIQVLLFGILAVELKRKAPNAHTMLEIVRARWGKAAHLTFLCFAFTTNIIVCSMLILGGAAVIQALTNMNLYAASILIPVGVIMYTAHGGLKATFLSTYLHTIVVFIALCLFAFEIYAVKNTGLGSPGNVWTHLTDIATLGGAFKGGGLMWFCIPFTLATSLGLAAVALDLPITASEAAEGLVPPAVAVYILGKSGAVWITIMLFMAVTSTGSAELIAVSSLFSYDVYRTYWNPKATGKDIIRVSRYVIVGFGLLMGVLAIILFKIGLSLGWVYLFMGIAIGGAVAPIYMCLVWSKANASGAITGAICDWKTTREIPTIEEDASAHAVYEGEDSMEAMNKARKIMMRVGWGLSFILIILWPLLALPAGVFSKGYFTFWVILAITWGLIATVVSTTMPLWEARESLWTITRNLFTCAAPTPEEETKGEAQPGDFAQQMFPAPSFAEKMDRMDGEKSSP
ncbi:hypothetical protein COHA_007348 [Chlorella ohadii]|uniref:Urea active transporter n=1 Tax=Chlorella ohadii TaxID=2649997 RepID=A0AAD5H4C2_9CHLO|nr:hypothetical protein COHA_007348 [Chlorella ohadii]